jgi:hypothetical protein
MATTVDQVLAFAARYGNKVLQAQVQMKAPLWDKLEHVPMSGQVGIINAITAGQQSAKFILDGGTRSSGTSNTPVQGTVRSVFIDCPLVLNKGVLMTLNGKADSANYLDGQLKSSGDTLAQMIGTNLYGSNTSDGSDGYVGSVTAVVSAFSSGVATFTVRSPAGFKEGMAITYVNSAAQRAFILRISGVALSVSDFTANVTVTNDIVGIAETGNNTNAALALLTSAAGDDLCSRGSVTNEGINTASTSLSPSVASAAAATLPVSLSLLAGSASVYGISAGDCLSTGFIGSTWTSAGDPTQESFLLRMKRIHQKSGDMPDLVCVGPMTAAVLGFSALTPATAGGLGSGDIVGQSRRTVDGKLDKYGREISSGSGVSLGGKEVMEDVNLGDADAFLVSKQYCKIGVWQDIEAEKQGGDTLLIKQDAFAKIAFFNAAFNLMCTKRSSVGKMTGITVSFV